MLARLNTFSLLGIDALPVEVEVDDISSSSVAAGWKSTRTFHSVLVEQAIPN
jgi:hypothetical protein